MKISRNVILGSAVPLASALILGGTLFQTVLFHLSPIKIGYQRRDYGSFEVISRGGGWEPDLASMPELMAGAERAHGLRFASKPRLVLCPRQSDMDLHMPYLDPRDRARAAAFAAWPDTVYLTPKARDLPGGARGPIAHELSHLLLYQNYGFARTALLWRIAEWIPEGFATRLSGWPDYFPPERLKERAAAAGIDPSGGGLFGRKGASDFALPIRFMVYRGFVDRLLRAGDGAEAIRFLHAACERPGRVEAAFRASFGLGFRESIAEFWGSQ
jgi:hypothetical protein